jgi:hypothetical protein
MLLMFVTAQTHFSPLAQPSPGGQHPALLASYVKRPPWKVAGVDHAGWCPVDGDADRLEVTEWPGITVNTTAMPPYVRVDNTSNVVISGVDFSLHGGAAIFCVDSPNLTVTSSKFGGTNLAHAPASIIFADRDSPNFTVSCNTIEGGGNGAGSSLDAEAIAEAAMRPTMRFVEVKSQAQSDMQAPHRARERLVSERTAGGPFDGQV